MRVWRARPIAHIFSIAHFKRIHTTYPKTPLLAILMQRYARLARHSKHTHTRYAKTLVLALVVQRYVRSVCHTQKVLFWHCAFQTHTYEASKHNYGGTFGVAVCAFGTPHQNHTFFGIVHFQHTHTRSPKTFLVAILVQWYACSAHHTKNTPFWHCAFQIHT